MSRSIRIGFHPSDSYKSGNAGTQHYGTNHDVAASDIDGLIELSVRLGVDFVVVGPEAPLCDGLADKLIGQGIPCFGPQQVHAELEKDRSFCETGDGRCSVPTAGTTMS